MSLVWLTHFIFFKLLAAFEMLTYSHHEGQIFVGNALGFTLLEDPMVKVNC